MQYPGNKIPGIFLLLLHKIHLMLINFNCIFIHWRCINRVTMFRCQPFLKSDQKAGV